MCTELECGYFFAVAHTQLMGGNYDRRPTDIHRDGETGCLQTSDFGAQLILEETTNIVER